MTCTGDCSLSFVYSWRRVDTNCNYNLRYCAATYLQRGQARPRWTDVVAQKLWPVTEAVVTVLCTPDDGCVWHPKHVEWTCRIINRLLCVASRWTIVNTVALIHKHKIRNILNETKGNATTIVPSILILKTAILTVAWNQYSTRSIYTTLANTAVRFNTLHIYHWLLHYSIISVVTESGRHFVKNTF